MKTETHFIWVDSGECSNFSHFEFGEPNNANHQEHCIECVVHGRQVGKWNDIRCDERRLYVCEKYQDTTAPSYGSSCPDDIHVIAKNKAVSVYWKPPTWTDDSSCHPTVTSSYSSGHVIHIPDNDLSASINVTYTATDNAGNSETCYFRVTASYTGCLTPDSSGYPGLQTPVSSENLDRQIPDTSEYPGLQTPVSSEYLGLTIGIFCVGIIVGVFGVLAVSVGCKKFKQTPTQTSQTYMGYVADVHNKNNEHTYEDLQHKTEEEAAYATITT
ncbi:macrophage mannose receptor 1-like [Anneissia japonica]|uniref:macrophage mannose receptor 1-like n=1 Tax=Anneissia japonica TaxID=1529436 RepID=UPI0014257080|nr:macrophage mannose receptor 1-like [Anneissia japonica]